MCNIRWCVLQRDWPPLPVSSCVCAGTHGSHRALQSQRCNPSSVAPGRARQHHAAPEELISLKRHEATEPPFIPRHGVQNVDDHDAGRGLRGGCFVTVIRSGRHPSVVVRFKTTIRHSFSLCLSLSLSRSFFATSLSTHARFIDWRTLFSTSFWSWVCD